MSWDGYITTILSYCGDHCDSAAIIGTDGSIWTSAAAPSGIKIQANESNDISAAFRSNDYSKLSGNGIFLGGVKYNFVRQTDDGIIGKKKDGGAVILQKSQKCIIIAHAAEGKSAGNVANGVQKMIDYLVTVGY